ncbi:MAG: hypothetical protein K2K81_11110 [Muribaculaceae bacterium]|nr:hypothetical protein [Muribaculaceae bacterium]
MTQIIVTLDNDINPNFIKKIFESIRGVVKISVRITTNDESSSSESLGALTDRDLELQGLPEEKRKWLEQLDMLCENIDRSVIDHDDEKTQYILSK